MIYRIHLEDPVEGNSGFQFAHTKADAIRKRDRFIRRRKEEINAAIGDSTSWEAPEKVTLKELRDLCTIDRANTPRNITELLLLLFDWASHPDNG